jgi:hypothetical protein
MPHGRGALASRFITAFDLADLFLFGLATRNRITVASRGDRFEPGRRRSLSGVFPLLNLTRKVTVKHMDSSRQLRHEKFESVDGSAPVRPDRTITRNTLGRNTLVFVAVLLRPPRRQPAPVLRFIKSYSDPNACARIVTLHLSHKAINVGSSWTHQSNMAGCSLTGRTMIGLFLLVEACPQYLLGQIVPELEPPARVNRRSRSRA